MLLNSAFRQKKVVIFAAFLFSAFIIGVSGALQSPTLSRFLTFEVNANPILVGTFYSVNAIGCIIFSFLLAKYSDKKGQRRNIVIFCCCMGIGNSLVFAFNREYFILITLGVFFSSLASAAMPQIFALAREYAVKTGRNVVAFNSLIRAQLSLAWVIGPPLSFVLAIQYGFTFMYLTAVAMYLIAIVVVALFLPLVERNPITTETIKSLAANPNTSIIKNKSVVFLFLATVSMWTANMMYLIDMPLYIDESLHLSQALPGHLMGVAAGLEIPIMLIAGYLVPYVGKRNLIFFGVICGGIFYVGVILFQTAFALYTLQIFNALFIGIVANIGIIYFQDLLPTRMGVASTLFNNGVLCSSILGGMLQGIISDWYGHQFIYYASFGMIILSLLFCTQVKAAK